ncbi:hypothetical protein BASA84_000255 [Batrachochytrium salamandrivorans]|nr:hypothetical protein BASA84_000255 [Batrachochytrium salamandrivorans]
MHRIIPVASLHSDRLSLLLYTRSLSRNHRDRSLSKLHLRAFSQTQPLAMKYSLQICGTHSGDTSPSVLLRFDSARYLFNCGEGTQRLCNEHKIRLSKLRSIFMTRTKWECVGGLPGMILTLADAGLETFQLYGPRNLSHCLAATRTFIFRRNIAVDVVDITSSDFEYKDENLSMRVALLTPDKEEFQTPQITNITGLKRKSSDMSDHGDRDANFLKKVIQRMFPKKETSADESELQNSLKNQERGSPTNGYSWNQLPRTSDAGLVLCYICKGPDVAGKLDPVLAKSLGVVRGPDMGKLKAGETVFSADGTPITPDQCVGPNRLGPTFLIIDCPAPSYITSLTTNKEIMQAASASGDHTAKCVVHLCGDNVLADDRYIEFMNSFPATTQHIYISEKHNRQNIVFEATTTIQHKLNLLDQNLFPLPYAAPLLRDLQAIPGLPKSAIPSELLQSYQFEPKSFLDMSECRPEFTVVTESSTHKDYLADVEETVAAINAAESSQSTIKSDDYVVGASLLTKNPTDGVSITPLGTGSAIPGKYRNVSSTIIQTPQGTYLLDSGEGTYGQLFRRFGPIELSKVLNSLSLMLISHMHADHHLGVISVLLAWEKATRGLSKKLLLVAPRVMWTWLTEYSQIQDLALERIEFVPADSIKWLPNESQESHKEIDIGILSRAGLSKLTTVGVIHCPDAFAVVAETTAGFKFAFSGDCRPSMTFAKVGAGAHFLLHEATFDDEKLQEAVDRRHCTINEALQIGHAMNADHILLTHFSQRYPKMPNIEASPNGTVISEKTPIVGIAFDLMRITFKDFWKLPLMVPALKRLFPSEE